jgi:uncharacterized protein (TIGR02246 family)
VKEKNMQPADVIHRFARCAEDGDLETAVALYEPDAVFQPAPDQPPVSGVPAIRAALEPFFALRPRMTGEIVKVLEAGDTALVVNRWTLRATGLELAGTSADVLRRRPDGGWAIVVDDPWGGG